MRQDHPVKYIILILLTFALADAIGAEKQQSARLNARVEAGEIFTTRLGNLPRGAKLRVGVEIDGEVEILLLDKEDLADLPNAKRPFFIGKTSDRLRFDLRIPESGDYFLVMDNRTGSSAREFSLDVSARAAADSELPEETAAKLKQAYRELDEFEGKLRKVFVFEQLSFKIGRCGAANTFSGSDTIYICVEMGRRLMQEIADQAKARDALLFAMLHEIGHILLEQWEYPFYDNEEVADEFATVLMVMFGQAERARVQAEYLSRQSPDKELDQKRNRDDRHPLSVQRARNIMNWLEDPDLVRRWQKILVPNMQTHALRVLEAQPQAWTDTELVKEELVRRRSE